MTEIILCGVMIATAILQHLERRDLYNRLMSRDYADYKRMTEKTERTEQPCETAHQRAIRKWREAGMKNGQDK